MNQSNLSLLIAALLSLARTCSTLAAAGAKPNVLIIHTDEHNFRTLGCYREHLPKEQAFIWGADEPSFTTDFLADKAVTFIKAHKDQPFFFTVSIPDPHRPNSVRPPYDTMYEKFKFKRPASSGGKGPFENMARYFGMVKCIDDNVGKMLAALRDLGQKERVAKSALWANASHIVLMIKGPGTTTPGAVCAEPASLRDLYPTVCELAQVPPPGQLEGKSLLPLLKTPKQPTDRTIVTTQEYKNHAVRDREWTHMRYEKGAEELYNNLQDPNEWTNLASKVEFSDVKKRLALSLPKTDAQLKGFKKSKGDSDGE